MFKLLVVVSLLLSSFSLTFAQEKSPLFMTVSAVEVGGQYDLMNGVKPSKTEVVFVVTMTNYGNEPVTHLTLDSDRLDFSQCGAIKYLAPRATYRCSSAPITLDMMFGAKTVATAMYGEARITVSANVYYLPGGVDGRRGIAER